MNYALIENNMVINIIYLLENNADDFPTAIFIGDLPVGIGDTYSDGKFYREGVEILTMYDEARVELDDMRAALNTLEVHVNG